MHNMVHTMSPLRNVWMQDLPKAKSLEEVALLLKSTATENYYDIYHPLPFYELGGLRTAVKKSAFLGKIEIIKDAASRLMIEKMLKAVEMKVIDIGASAGGIALALAIDGFNVTAVEPDEKYFSLGITISRLRNIDINWRNESLETAINEQEHYHVAILSSVFQWAAKGGENIKAAGKALHWVSEHCDHMMFEQGFTKGTSCFVTDNPDHYQEIIKLLLMYTSYNDFKMLSTTELYPGQMRYLVLCSGHR